jgi:CheY-like chemotaxis protein
MKNSNENAVKKNVRVVVIEDNSDDSDLLVRQLQKNNFAGSVQIIPDGKRAWDLLLADDSRQNLIAIFLDLHLPSLSGIKLLDRIRSHPELRTVPVFVMTSSNNPKDVKKCVRLGVEGIIIKPVTFTTFSKAIADLFHAPNTLANGYARAA